MKGSDVLRASENAAYKNSTKLVSSITNQENQLEFVATRKQKEKGIRVTRKHLRITSAEVVIS